MIHSDVATAGSVDTTGPVTVDRDAIKALIGSALGYAMDGFDLLILGFMLKMISADLSLTQAQGASLVTATLIGAVIGGVFFGMLSDKIGRVRVLTYTIVVFAVFTGLCGLARGYYDLLAYRTLAGVGLGGEFGLGHGTRRGSVAVVHAARARRLMSASAGSLACWPPPSSPPLLLPVIGWRGMFMLGIFPAVAAYFIRSTLHEPEVFVKKSHDHPSESALHLLVDSARNHQAQHRHDHPHLGAELRLLRRHDLAASYLSSRFGFALTQSAVWTIVTIAGMAVGIFMFGPYRRSHRPASTFLTYMIGAAVMVVVYSRLTDPMYLLVAGAVMGFFVNGMLGGYGALMSELYPTAARATAQNVLFNVGRAVGGFGPVVVGAVATMYSFETAIGLLAALYCLDILALWFLIPETARRSAFLENSCLNESTVSSVPAANTDVASQGRSAASPAAEFKPSVVADLTTVIANEPVNAEYRHLVANCSIEAARAKPGQFFQLLCPHSENELPYLRRPMSVYGTDPDKREISFLYKIAGAGRVD